MTTRDEILAANAEGTLVDFIAAEHYAQGEALADLLSEMHNSGEIDILATCSSGQLDAISGHPFFVFQRVFCLTLPRIRCRAEAAMTASTQVFEKAGADLCAGLAYEALRKWFQQSSERTEEGLAVIHCDMDNQTGTVRALLLAGAGQDAEVFTDEALHLSEQTQPQIRSDALWALGRVAPKDDDGLQRRALRRLREAVDAPTCSRDAAVAVESALHLLHKTDGRILDAVKPLLERACSSPTPLLRQTLARSLQDYRSAYDERMINTTLSTLETADREDVHTARSIDLLLCEWDIDGDRERVLGFLSNLLGGKDEAIGLDELDNFRERVRNERGEVLGWYAVSFLLTGDDRLCEVAEQVLPYNETRDGLDVDLGPFALTAPWFGFLTRRILGYCLFKKESAAALLLSCLRAAPEPDSAEIEDLIFDHYFMNYLTAIEWFKNAISKDDPARQSVRRLSLKVKSYVDSLSELGTCPAFRPTERERQLQGYRQADFWRTVQKQAEETSVFSLVMHKATILYGTASIAYVYTDSDADPHRQEISMASHEHVAEFPRLDAVDPVGLRYTIHCFRSEPPPT